MQEVATYRRRRAHGFTLIELLVVLAVVAAAVGAAILTDRARQKQTARAAAGRMAAAIRYTFDRAVATGGYYRMVLDLTSNKYYVERSDARFYMSRDKEQGAGRGKAFDDDAKQRALDEAEAEEKRRLTGLAAQLQPPPVPRRARFQAFQDAALPQVDLKGCKIRDVYTPRQREPYTEGKAYLYFFPDGHTERAAIHVETAAGDLYTLFLHPLTGRVQLLTGDVPLPRGFDDTDDDGQTQVAR